MAWISRTLRAFQRANSAWAPDAAKNYTRCQNVLDSLQKTRRFPPRNDVPGSTGCVCGRRLPKLGLNDACYTVWPGNYGALLDQISPWATSVGAWRVGPKDEISGRYSRSARKRSQGSKAALAFRTMHGVFGATEQRGKIVYVRVVFLADSTATAVIEHTGGSCASAGVVSGAGGSNMPRTVAIGSKRALPYLLLTWQLAAINAAMRAAATTMGSRGT